MKKVLFVSIAALLVCGCSTPEKSAQKLIKDYLAANLNDAKSYEGVEFGTLDSVFTTLKDTPYYRYKSKFDYFINEAQFATNMLGITYSKKESKEYEEKFNTSISEAEKYSQMADSVADAFVPEFKGWQMTHKYRAKNGVGALNISTAMVQFDKDLTTVTNFSDEQ